MRNHRFPRHYRDSEEHSVLHVGSRIATDVFLVVRLQKLLFLVQIQIPVYSSRADTRDWNGFVSNNYEKTALAGITDQMYAK